MVISIVGFGLLLSGVLLATLTDSTPERFHSTDGLLVEFRHSLRIFVFRFWQERLHRQNAVRISAAENIHNAPETDNHQTSANQQDEGQSHFHNHQKTAGVTTARAFAGPAAFFESVIQIQPRRLQGGQETKNQGGKRRDAKREKKHAAVDSNLFPAGHEPCYIGWQARANKIDSPYPHEKSPHPGETRQQKAFGHQLPNRVPPAGAQGRAYRDFLAACFGAGKNKVDTL